MVSNETVKKVWNGLTLTLEAFTNKEQYPEYEILQLKTSAKTDFQGIVARTQKAERT